MSYWCHECLRGFTPQPPQQPPPPHQSSVSCPQCGSDFVEWTNEPPLSSEDEDYSGGEDFEDQTLWLPPRRLMMLENHLHHPHNYHHHNFNNNANTPASSSNLDYTDLARWFLSMGIGRGPIANLGDYGIGQSLDDILNMSFEQDQSSGPPPASKKELSRLKRIKITKEHVAGNLECTVCTEKYRINEFCHLLPCKHFFHQDCIKPWLQLHNTCPVCRYELKTDDIEYEAKKKKFSNTPTSPTLTTPINAPNTEVDSTTINSPTPTPTPTPNSMNPILNTTTIPSPTHNHHHSSYNHTTAVRSKVPRKPPHNNTNQRSSIPRKKKKDRPQKKITPKNNRILKRMRIVIKVV